jgi:hypothetical protein
MGTETTIEPRGASVRGKPARTFVNAAEYCALVISNRPLVRLDDANSCLRGLHDPATGVTYVIHEDKLFGQRN